MADSSNEMNVDTMLAHAGDFSRYQILLLVLFSALNILSSFHYFNTLFIGDVPDHWCRLPNLNLSLADDDVRDQWTPRDAEQRRCYRYDVNMTGMTTPSGRETWGLRRCDEGWEYDRVWGYDSIVSEMNWVCDDQWRAPLGLSLFFVGCVIGTLLLGILADHIGRLHVLVIANFVAFVGNVTSSYATGFEEFVVCRFVAGMATDNNFYMLYIIVLEYLRPSKRTLGLNLTIGVFYTVGSTALPWISLALGTWRRLLFITTLPLLAVPLFYVLVPESARWLLSKGRTAEAIRCFQRVAAFNGRKLDPDLVDQFKRSAEAVVETRPSNLLGLFRTPRLCRKTCILIFKSIVLTLCYDAISRNVSGLGYNSFIVFSITSVVTLPGCGIILLLQDRIGRKAMASSSLAFTGVCMIVAAVVLAIGADKAPVTVITLSFLGRLGINVAYTSGVQYAAELIPTEVRGQGVSMIHMTGYLVLFASPYILMTERLWIATPYLLIGSMAILGALLCLLLPETLDKVLPVTLEDGEWFGEGEGVWEFACCRRRRSRRRERKRGGDFYMTLSTEELVLGDEKICEQFNSKQL